MLYKEFLEGTGCRENEHNYEVYKRVEQIYNNDNSMTHAEAYKIAEMWLDNSLSNQEIETNKQIQAEIEEMSYQVKEKQHDIDYYKSEIAAYKNSIAAAKNEKTELLQKIKNLKSCIIK